MKTSWEKSFQAVGVTASNILPDSSWLVFSWMKKQSWMNEYKKGEDAPKPVQQSPVIHAFTSHGYSRSSTVQNIKWKVPEINNSEILNCATSR